MPMYDDLGNKFLTLPEQVNKNKKDIKVIQDAGISVEPAGEPGDIQFNEDDALGASANLHWDMLNERLGVGTNEPAEKLHVVGSIKTEEQIIINKSAEAGREVLFKARVEDAVNDQFGIANGTSGAGVFAPAFYGSSTGPYAMVFRGLVNASDDQPGDGYLNYGIVNIETYRASNPADPNNSTWTRIENRKIFSIVNGPGASRTYPLQINADDSVEMPGDVEIGGDVDILGGLIMSGGLNVGGAVVINGDLDIDGNFHVNGTMTVLNTETLEVEDNIIKINKGQTGTPLATLKSGIEVERGDEDNYFFVFDESDDSFKIGKTVLQPVATREDTPTNEAVPHWNSTTKKFETTGGLYKDAAAGRVGIGTTSPRQALDVNGAIIAKNVVSNGLAAHPTGIGPYVETYIYSGNIGRLFCYDGSTYYDLAIGDWNAGNPNIMLKVGGNVGIGIGAPTERLHVAGKVKATEFVGPLVGDVTGDLTGNADTATEAIRAFSYQDDANVDRLISFVATGSPDSYRASYRDQDGSLKYNPYTKVLTVPTVVANVTGTASGNLPSDAEMDDLDDVDITSPSDGQFLKYDNASGTWKNTTVTPGSSTRTITLLGNTTSTSNLITLTVADIHDYDEIRVQYHTRKGSGTTASPYFYGISSVTTDSALWGYYSNTPSNQFWRIGAELAAPNGNGESTFLNVQVLQNNADGTSVYIDIEGTRVNIFNIRLYGINH